MNNCTKHRISKLCIACKLTLSFILLPVVSALAESSFYQADYSVGKIALLFMIPVLFIFGFGVFVVYRKKRENEFRQLVSNVEIKALRAQINPHFIFNCLNSINSFMQSNNAEQASGYLVKFSKLIRMILENSEYKEIQLQKDLQAMQLYMQLEQMRLPQGFDFEINVDDTIDQKAVVIPPMIMQPFIENCIWHGLKAKQSKGLIRINASLQNKMLKITIEDNGVEVLSHEISDSYKKKSMGISITRQRIEVMNKLKNEHADFKISDIRSQDNTYLGKRVELWLPSK